MKCWKCGQENASGTINCINCGTSLARSPVKTPTGKAMRALYDQYGCKKVLTETIYLKNGLGDFLEDSTTSRTIRSQIGMAMDAGLGRVYYEQLIKGRPDNSSSFRAEEILTRECGFSNSTANEIMGYFDEMIGWKAAERSAVSPNKKPSVPLNDNNKPSSAPIQNHKKTQIVPPSKPAAQNQNELLSPGEIKWLKASNWIVVIIWGIFSYYHLDTSGFLHSEDYILLMGIIIGFLLLFSALTISFPNCPRIPFLSYFCVVLSSWMSILIIPSPLIISNLFGFFDAPFTTLKTVILFCFIPVFAIILFGGMAWWPRIIKLASRWVNNDRRTREESMNE